MRRWIMGCALGLALGLIATAGAQVVPNVGQTVPAQVVPASAVNGGGTVISSQLLLPDGTAAAPAYSFASDPDTGFFTGTGNTIGVTAGGSQQFRFAVGALWGLSDTAALQLGSAADVSLSRGAANRLDLASGDDLYLVSGGLGVGTAPSAGAGAIQLSGSLTAAGAVNATTAYRLGSSTSGAATTTFTTVKKITGIADNSATAVATVTIPNGNHAATIRVTILSSNGSTDAFESSRTALGQVVLARTTGVTTVATAATLTLTGIATVAAGATHTLAYGTTAMVGAAGATQTFTITVTIDDSGNLGSNQAVVLLELVNAEASGVTIA